MPSDYEQFWFLMHSPFIKFSAVEKKNKQGRYFMEFYDPEQYYTTQLLAERAEAAVKSLIKNDESNFGVTVEKLEEVADALYIPRNAWRGHNHLRFIILEKIEADQKAPGLSGDSELFGWKYALQLLNGDDANVDVKIQISRALDKKVIEFDSSQNAWFYRDTKTGS